MSNELQVKQPKTFTIIQKIDEFLYSKYFLFMVALVTLTCHTFSLSIYGLGFLVAIACYILLTRKDSLPIISMALMVIFIFNDYTITTKVYFYIMLSPLVVCFIAHLFLFPSSKFSLGKLFYPLLAVSTSLILGGLFSSEYRTTYTNGLLEIVVFGPLLLLIYLFFRNNICPKENVNIKEYFVITLLLCCLIPVAEYYNLILKDGYTEAMKSAENLGWGNYNVISTLLIMAIPLICYLMTKSKTFIPYLLLLIFDYATIFICTSDACKGIALFLSIPNIIYTYFLLPKQKRQYYLNYVFAIFSATLIMIAIFEYFDVWDEIKQSINTQDSGRADIYKEAFNCFKQSPLFGAGMGYAGSLPSFGVGEKIFHNFHSSFFHILGKLGIVGVIAYSYLYYMRYKILLNNHSRYNVFITLSFSAVMSYALVDTAEFNIMPFGLLFVFIILITELLNENDKREEKLPLSCFYYL